MSDVCGQRAASTQAGDGDMLMEIGSYTGAIHVGAGQPLGPVTVFPIWSGEPPSVGHLTSASGSLAVTECFVPQIPRLLVANLASEPVLILEGETLRGGHQDRVTTATHLLAPGDSAEVPVACVEQGRWARSGSGLQRVGHSTPSLRARNGHALARSRRTGGWESDQGATWGEVERLRSRHQAPAPTSSLHDVSSHAALGAARGPVPRPLDGQRGVILAFDGAVRSLDLFANSADLEHYWEALLAAALLEAGTVATSPVRSGHARRFVRSLVRAPVEVTPGLGLGRDLRASTPTLVAAGLLHEERLLHLAAFDLALAA